MKSGGSFRHLLNLIIVLLALITLLVVAVLTTRLAEHFDNWMAFFIALIAAGGGVITGVLVSLLSAWLSRFLSNVVARIYDASQASAIALVKGAMVGASLFLETSSSLAKGIDVLGFSIAESIMDVSSSIKDSSTQVIDSLDEIGAAIRERLAALDRKLKTPKWYYEKGAIDTGLIEVSLAVTAVLVALPSVGGSDATFTQIFALKWLRFLSEVIPTLTSISLLDIYAKSKGAKSIHILLSPIEDGPFFSLGWAIVIGLVAIEAIAFQVSR